jgi:hypothetical protein
VKTSKDIAYDFARTHRAWRNTSAMTTGRAWLYDAWRRAQAPAWRGTHAQYGVCVVCAWRVHEVLCVWVGAWHGHSRARCARGLFDVWPRAQAPPPSPPPAQPQTPAQPPLPPSTPLANFVASEPDIEDFVSWMRALPSHMPSHPLTHLTYPHTRLCTPSHPLAHPLPGAPRRWPRCASRCCASSRTCRPASTR